MKMLKKLAALVLAATMVLVLFTACGGDTAQSPRGSGGSSDDEHNQCKSPRGKETGKQRTVQSDCKPTY